MKKAKSILISTVSIFILYLIFYISGIGCPIKFITGISCGGCGMTRAWINIFRFDFKDAFYYHPLVLLPPIYLLILMFRKQIENNLFKIINALFIILFISVYILRLLNPNDNIVVFNPENGIIFKIIYYFMRRC